MPSFHALAASLALVLPIYGQGPVVSPTSVPSLRIEAQEGTAPRCSAPVSQNVSHSEKPAPAFPYDASASSPLNAFHHAQTAQQVRIEQRVTIRISPLRQNSRNNLLARLPQRGLTTTFEEREMSRCVPISGIAGVQTGTGNRLLLFLRDQRIVSVNLERACRARDFYSGFYIERNEDGNLCVDRDLLQSRSGAKCEVERMRQLVAVGD